MATRQEKVNAGLFLLTGVLLVGAVIALIVGVQLQTSWKTYHCRFDVSVRGLEAGSWVSYKGLDVGRVKDMWIDYQVDPRIILVDLEVQADYPLKDGTTAVIRRNYLTGSADIELQPGAGADLPAGSVIPVESTTLSKFEDSLPGALESLVGASRAVNDFFGPENRDAARELVAQASGLMSDGRGELVHLRGRVDELADLLQVTLTSLDAQVVRGVDSVVTTSGTLNRTMGQLEGVAADIRSGTAQLDALLGDLRGAASRAGQTFQTVDLWIHQNQPTLTRTLAHLQSSARHLELLLATLESDPSALLFAEPRSERRRRD